MTSFVLLKAPVALLSLLVILWTIMSLKASGLPDLPSLTL